MSQRIYLDYASATPADDRVQKAMELYWSKLFFNPSAIYQEGREAKIHLGEIKKSIAGLIGARQTEIVLTSGGTEANNLAIKGVMDLYPGANCLISAVEHDSVLKPAENYKRSIIPVDKNGRIDLLQIQNLINNHTVLISVQLANNEIGTLQPVKQVAELIASVKTARLKLKNYLPLYLHSDVCQALNYAEVNVNGLGVDLMSANGGKIYGPKGSGFLYVKGSTQLMPIIEGGGQEHNLRSGTENLAAAAGLAEAMRITDKLRQKEAKRLAELSDFMRQEVLANITGASFNGPVKKRLPNNLNFSFERVDNERLLIRLDMAGVMASAGSACSASSGEPSHVLKAIDLKPAEIRSSIRISLGRQTTLADVKNAVKILMQCVDKEQ